MHLTSASMDRLIVLVRSYRNKERCCGFPIVDTKASSGAIFVEGVSGLYELVLRKSMGDPTSRGW